MLRYIMQNDFRPVLREAVGALAKNARVLNIACEFDLVPTWLRGKVLPENVFGLELNPEIANSVPNIRACDVDREKFPFASDSFDLVISVWGLEHFQTENVFAEARRVLKPGGRFVFIVPNLNHPAFFLNKLAGGKLGGWYYRHVSHVAYHPHQAYYRFNRLGVIRKVAKHHNLIVREAIYLGPAGILEYLSFSPLAQKLATWIERCFTNRWLYFFKPYLVCVLEK